MTTDWTGGFESSCQSASTLHVIGGSSRDALALASFKRPIPTLRVTVIAEQTHSRIGLKRAYGALLSRLESVSEKVKVLAGLFR